jgi:uncharacterized protein (UPF0332 family)
MFDKLIKKYKSLGRIKKQKVGVIQVEALLRQAVLDLDEAKKILSLAERASYLSAYMAMLKAGRALLLFKGYRPDDGAQHKTVVELTGAILGEEFRNLTSQFETMRRKRNDMTYEAGVLLSKTEAREALNDAI